MFQSIKYIKYLDYNATTKLHSSEYELVDSDFSCAAAGVAVVVREPCPGGTIAAGAVIQEYSKRKLNVATNLIRCFKYHEKEYGWSIAEQIEWAEKYQPLFTPELKQELAKYLVLV